MWYNLELKKIFLNYLKTEWETLVNIFCLAVAWLSNYIFRMYLGNNCIICFFVNRVIPNCQFRSKTARLKTFTANQIDEIKDPSGLFYILPFQKVIQLYAISSNLNLS